MNNILSISQQTYIILFKKICDTIKNLSEYLYIKITYDNIIFQVIDEIKISIVNISFDKNYFDIFDINYQTDICINISDFTKILKNFTKNSTIKFKFNHKTNILSIKSDKNDLIIKNFKINLLDTSFYDWININKINYDNKISISSKTLQTIISELNAFSDYLTIKKKHNSNILQFIISQQDNIYSKYEVDNINIFNSEDIELSVSLNYLNNFKLFSNFDYTYLSISNNNPLHINLNNNNINIDYMLAPKVID